ncbi:hypothetical protein [Oceanobacillus sp. 1P07AA]|uniref:hypothetical protein n=1 Tax=Oceanobacillus sp. 1P07AA TaxID=3132293 RepID=UPI0039A69CAC
MNTEINLIEKKTNKYRIIYIFIFIISSLLLVMIGILLFQHHQAKQQLDTTLEQLVITENSISETNQLFSNKQYMNEVQSSLNNIQDNMVHYVNLYHAVSDLLPNNEQLVEIELGKDLPITISTVNSNMDETITLLSKMDEQPYILDTDLININKTDNQYTNTILIDLDQEKIKKEFPYNE